MVTGLRPSSPRHWPWKEKEEGGTVKMFQIFGGDSWGVYFSRTLALHGSPKLLARIERKFEFFPYKFCKPTSKRDIVLLRVNERGCCFHPFYTFFFCPCSPASVDRFPSTCWRKVLPAKSEKVRESAFELQRTIYKRLASPVSFFPAWWRERTRTNTLETKNFRSTETSHTMSQSNESIVAARGRWE